MNDKDYQGSSDSYTLKEFLLKGKEWAVYLKSKWLIILIVGFLGGVVGFYRAYRDVPVYTATLSFVLEDDKSSPSLGGALGLASQFGIDLGSGGGGGIFTGANLIELFKSRTMVEMALLAPVVFDEKNTTLAEVYVDINNMRQLWAGRPEFENIHFLSTDERTGFTLAKDSILSVIYKKLMLYDVNIGQRDKKNSFIYLDVKSTNQLFAKQFTEVLISVVSDFYIETKSKKSKTNVAILEKQADSIRNELNSAILGVASSNDNTYNLNPALNIKRVPTTKRSVDVQMNSAILTELVKNMEIAKVSLRKETPLIQIIDKPILPLKKEKAGKLITAITFAAAAVFLTLFIIIVRRFWKNINL